MLHTRLFECLQHLINTIMLCWCLQAGLAVCLSALQSSKCPGTAALAHLWAPVCAALLLVPQEQYSSLQGQTLQQHNAPQAPGIMQLLPVLRQMASLQEKVTEAAAGLVATALQVRARGACITQDK